MTLEEEEEDEAGGQILLVRLEKVDETNENAQGGWCLRAKASPYGPRRIEL